MEHRWNIWIFRAQKLHIWVEPEGLWHLVTPLGWNMCNFREWSNVCSRGGEVGGRGRYDEEHDW